MIIVLQNQTLLDIAVQEYGNAQAAFDIAVANNIGVTDDLTPGQKLFAPQSNYKNTPIAEYFRARKQSVTTGGAFIEIEIENYEFPGEFPFSF